MADQEQNNSGGFSKTTNFKWLAVGIALFTIIGFVIPTPTSMIEKAAAMGPVSYTHLTLPTKA